jgi:adenosylcobinamide-phosphate synthase
MVGYRTPHYLRFGWCGARLDDAMNYVPARLTFLLIVLAAACMPGASARKAWRIGWKQHGLLPSPNSGWSEAATAGAIERRIVGPIWKQGTLVTELWVGAPEDPPAATRRDLLLALRVNVLAGLFAAALATGALLLV